MCLVVNNKTPLIAIADIVVYKICNINYEGYLSGYCIDDYIYSKVETARMKLYDNGYNYYISAGLHSTVAIRESSFYGNKVLTKWVIPEGAKYYYASGNYVSNKLIFLEAIGIKEPKFVKRSLKRWISKTKNYIKAKY